MERPTGFKKVLSILFRFVRVVIVLAVAVGIGNLLYKLKKEPEKKELQTAAPSVTVLNAQPESKVMMVEAFGTVKPRKSIKISAEVPGRIDHINPMFIEGGIIQQGELLVRIDQRDYRLNKDAAAVRVRQARVDIQNLKQEIENLKKDIELSSKNTELTQRELERLKALSKNQYASKNSLEKAEQQHLGAKIQLQGIKNRLALTDTYMEQKQAALAMARVDLNKAALSLDKTEIRAEFEGFILDKMAEAGEYVNPGQALGIIYQKDSLDVDVRIPLEKMKWLEFFFKDGKTPEALVELASYEGSQPPTWKAKVARIKAKIDEKTRTLPLTLEIGSANKAGIGVFDIKPGTFVKCNIIGETYDNIFVIPRYLLRSNNILYTVNDSHLKMKKVAVLRKFEDEVYITAGLENGDKIISSPLPGAIAGMEITIKDNGK
ncbi:MAG: efflux RND transporter periplasmic adaptor subunit [Desulfobacteraceae bacterium]|nr:efflux RND transporter periplasmic adaptor subunit [Desulfobacteraceae bacterium]